MPEGLHPGRWQESLRLCRDRVKKAVPLQVEGQLTRLTGLTLEATGFVAPIGARCEIEDERGDSVLAEVVGFSGERVFLMASGHIGGVVPRARVRPSRNTGSTPVGQALLGRVLNGEGVPLDGLGALKDVERVSLHGEMINPLERALIRVPLDVGVRAINGFLTIGRGQRIGLFAGSGVGKSVLLGMITRYTEAEVIVLGLIGERGREVKEFIEECLDDAGRSKSVIVAAPADSPPLQRLHGALMATRIAEHFRDEGKDVLLLMDSLTRFAQAQREIALAIGETPATKGYPPSVFALLPRLVERAGNGIGHGSVTAIYTVLTEGDDPQDPIADSARAILDGHVVLSRELAEEGHYPAIDIESSVSRVMPHIVEDIHFKSALALKRLHSAYEENKDLISVGAYVSGTDQTIDLAREFQPKIRKFLSQDVDERVSIEQTRQELIEMVGERPRNEPTAQK